MSCQVGIQDGPGWEGGGGCKDLSNPALASNWCSQVKGPVPIVYNQDSVVANYTPVESTCKYKLAPDKVNHMITFDCIMNPDYPDPFYVKCCMNTAGDNYKYCPHKYCDTNKDNNCDNFMYEWCSNKANTLNPECGCINAKEQAAHSKVLEHLPQMVQTLLPSACYPSCSGGNAYIRSSGVDHCDMDLQVCQEIVNIMGYDSAKGNVYINQICKQHWNNIKPPTSPTPSSPPHHPPTPSGKKSGWEKFIDLLQRHIVAVVLMIIVMVLLVVILVIFTRRG